MREMKNVVDWMDIKDSSTTTGCPILDTAVIAAPGKASTAASGHTTPCMRHSVTFVEGNPGHLVHT